MVELYNVNEYLKSGRGNIFQFYITDQELQNILLTHLPSEFKPISLICYKYDSKGTFYFQERLVEEFINSRDENYERFFLRSSNLTPALIIPTGPVINAVQRAELQKYYVLNGLIDIQHGFKLEHKYFSESSIGHIPKYYLKSGSGNLILNEGYTKVFEVLKKSVQKILKYRSKEIWSNGKVNVSKINNVSEGFLEELQNGKVEANIEVE